MANKNVLIIGTGTIGSPLISLLARHKADFGINKLQSYIGNSEVVLLGHSAGGVIALHDTVFREGPTKVSKELIKSGKFSDIGFVDDITFAVKDPEASKVSTAFSLLSRELALKLLWIRIPVFRNAVKKLFFKQYV